MIPKSKYGSKWVEIDGIKFQSKKEAKKWGELRMLVKAGEINELERQVAYELNPGGSFSYKYKADFRFRVVKTGEIVVMDVKGFRTGEYKKKAKLMLKVHGITITEV